MSSINAAVECGSDTQGRTTQVQRSTEARHGSTAARCPASTTRKSTRRSSRQAGTAWGATRSSSPRGTSGPTSSATWGTETPPSCTLGTRDPTSTKRASCCSAGQPQAARARSVPIRHGPGNGAALYLAIEFQVLQLEMHAVAGAPHRIQHDAGLVLERHPAATVRACLLRRDGKRERPLLPVPINHARPHSRERVIARLLHLTRRTRARRQGERERDNRVLHGILPIHGRRRAGVRSFPCGFDFSSTCNVAECKV